MLISYQWHIFITLEIISVLSALLFIVLRYGFKKRALSSFFLLLFILPLLLEALLAYTIYQQTGEITSFHIVVGLFVLYACTLGVSDFKKLDRKLRKWIGERRGENLLTERDLYLLAREKDSRYLQKKSIFYFALHTIIFSLFIFIMWSKYGNTHFTFSMQWFSDAKAIQPFTSELATNILQVWIVVYIIDSLINLSYIFFPSKK